MDQALFDLAKTYLFDLVIKNEAVQKFPKDFVTEGMKWVRSWFLKDDPATTAVVDSETPAAVKEVVLTSKLSKLLENPQFVEELRAQLAGYETPRPRVKSKIEGSSVSQANVHIGDKTPDGVAYDEKGIVKNTTFTGTGDFHLGDG